MQSSPKSKSNFATFKPALVKTFSNSPAPWKPSNASYALYCPFLKLATASHKKRSYCLCICSMMFRAIRYRT